MKKLGVSVAVVAVVLVAGIAWWLRSRGTNDAAVAAKSAATSTPAPTSRRETLDPTTQPRGSIAGTITAEDSRAPIPNARVCAKLSSDAIAVELTRVPICATADASGRYVLNELFAGDYEVAAGAKPYRSGVYRIDAARRDERLALGAGETKSGIDIALRGGGVEITGVVQDVTGGPVARALVTARRSATDELVPAVETDDHGAFSMYVAPGRVALDAQADGYSPGSDWGEAPGTFTVLLTPESSLAGTVVDAISGAPVAGVTVSGGTGEWFDFGDKASDITDAQGAFRLTRLDPARYSLSARGPHGYGTSAGSTLVGLGQHVTGVVVKLHPAFQVTGTVLMPDDKPCPKAHVSLRDEPQDRYANAKPGADHILRADGLLPGTYRVSVSCDDYQSRERYDDIVVVDKDVTGLVWRVDGGASITGRVTTKSGTPVEAARLWARSTGEAARASTDYGYDVSARDGTYTIKGLRAGTFELDMETDQGVEPVDAPKVQVAAGATVTKDLVLDDGGTLTGSVVDDTGAPVANVTVTARPMAGSWGRNNESRTATDGTFTIDMLRPGPYQVLAHSAVGELRKPGSNDDARQGEKVTVSLGKPATVRLVVESESGVIKGTVADAAGAPISDAFVAAARESDAAGASRSSLDDTRWTWDNKPVVTGTDGSFTLTGLTRGNYALRAYRKGGGEAVAEHVAAGTTTTLVIRPTGSIAGTVKTPSGAPIDMLNLEVVDAKTGFRRQEELFRTGGAFEIHDLPAGQFTLTASAKGGKRQLTVALAEGEQKKGIALELEELVTLTGRVVDMHTKAPVPAMRMFASLAKSTQTMIFTSEADLPNVTDENGAFTITGVPRGKLTIRGIPKDFDGDYGWISFVREVTGTSAKNDIGELAAIKSRTKKGERAGELGIKFAETPDGTEPEAEQHKVSFIDPAGPAAKLDIKVGDVVTTIDGVDITGVNHSYAQPLLRAPAGTTVKLGLQRGVTVAVGLAAP